MVPEWCIMFSLIWEVVHDCIWMTWHSWPDPFSQTGCLSIHLLRFFNLLPGLVLFLSTPHCNLEVRGTLWNIYICVWSHISFLKVFCQFFLQISVWVRLTKRKYFLLLLCNCCAIGTQSWCNSSRSTMLLKLTHHGWKHPLHWLHCADGCNGSFGCWQTQNSSSTESHYFKIEYTFS